MSTTEECKLGQTLEDTGYSALSTWNLRVGQIWLRSEERTARINLNSLSPYCA
jgi:hypothetical protein